MVSYKLFLDLAIIVVAAKLFGLLARKAHAPQVVGEIIAGLVIGPNVLGLVSQSDFLIEMAEIGVIPVSYTHLDVYKRQSLGPKTKFPVLS